MKILQGLVGYLAVTALPFHPFSVAASPLASINFDGYANKTNIDDALIKQVLDYVDSIKDTCQTVTTKKRSDGTLMNHVSGQGDIIEARQEEPIPPPPAELLVGAIIFTVILGILWITEENQVRGNDVEFLVEHLIQSLLLET